MILFTALVIAGIMMIWAVAATCQANFQSSATRYSYRKSELYYLAKRATSRALNQLNLDPAWLATYNSSSKADTSTPGTACWVDSASAPGTLLLRCKATVGTATEYLNVPILHQSDTDIHIYSITPAVGGGPDLIAWTTKNAATWNTLPPIPGVQKILFTTPTPNGDVYSIGQLPNGTGLWRYRTGQGWVQLPDAPGGVTLSSLSAGGNEQLICKGSDNTLLILPLGTSQSDPMQWKAVTPPSGLDLSNVAADPSNKALAYATGTDNGSQVVYQYDKAADSWTKYPAPDLSIYDPTSGALVSQGGAVTDFSGGMIVDKNGNVYAASNTAPSASVVYAFKPTTPGATTGNWTALPPLPALEWQGQTVSNPGGYATNVTHLQADEEGKLWGQSTNPTTQKYSIIRFETPP